MTADAHLKDQKLQDFKVSFLMRQLTCPDSSGVIEAVEIKQTTYSDCFLSDRMSSQALHNVCHYAHYWLVKIRVIKVGSCNFMSIYSHDR